MKKIRVAIIGCGDVAGGYDEARRGNGAFSHAGSYKLFSNIEIAAAYDKNKKRLDKFCRRWHVKKKCVSLKELLKDSYDIVSVCTPDNTHEKVLDAIIDSASTKYIWTEKPFVTNAKAAYRIIKKAKKKKVGLWLNNQRRWEPHHLKVKKDISAKKIGKVVSMTGYFVKGLTHIGVTAINTLRLFNGDIKWVKGHVKKSKLVSSVVGFTSGATGNIVEWDKECSIFEIDIIGAKGRIKIEDNGSKIYIYEAKRHRYYKSFKELKLVEAQNTKVKWAMKYTLSALLKDLKRKRCSYESVIQGAYDLKVVDAIKRSLSAGGKRINVR